MVRHTLHRRRAADLGEVKLRRPELSQLLFVVLHPAPDIGSVLGLALLVNEGWEVAAHTGRIHRVEEEKAVAAEEILHVVLGRGDKDIDACIVQQFVQALSIERQGLADRRLCYSHVSLPASVTLSTKGIKAIRPHPVRRVGHARTAETANAQLYRQERRYRQTGIESGGPQDGSTPGATG